MHVSLDHCQLRQTPHHPPCTCIYRHTNTCTHNDPREKKWKWTKHIIFLVVCPSDDRLTDTREGSWLRKCFSHLPRLHTFHAGRILESLVLEESSRPSLGEQEASVNGCFCFSEIYYNQGCVYDYVYMHVYVCKCAYVCMCICVLYVYIVYGRLFQSLLALSLWIELQTWLDIALTPLILHSSP